MDNEEPKPLSWEQQEEEIRVLNSLCIAEARTIIKGESTTVKFITKEGESIFESVADGIDMLARCSSIAKQWTAERRQAKPKDVDEDDVKQASSEDLMKAANK